MHPSCETVKWVILGDCGGGSFSVIDKRVILSDCYHHPHKRMSWNEKGRSFSRAVPKEDPAWIEEMTENYRKFRKLRKELHASGKKINDFLDGYEIKIVNQTRKGKIYLEIGSSEGFCKKGSESKGKKKMAT